MVVRRGEAVRHALLSAGAWLALLLYLLACGGPSWRPDGSAILFPYQPSDGGDDAIALYERATGEVTTFYRNDHLTGFTQWTRDGESAILAVGSDDLLVVSVQSREPVVQIDSVEGAESTLFPIPEVAGHVYFGGSAITRVNLATGALKTRELGEDEPAVTLYRAEDAILYARELDERFEIGMIDPEALTFDPRFALEREFLEGLHLDAITFASYEAKSSRFAMVATGPGEDSVIVFRGRGIEAVVKPTIPSPTYELGDIVWSADGRWLYAAVLTPWGEALTELSFAEFPANANDAEPGARTRITPITWIDSEFDAYDSDSMAFYFPLALSPDGRSLAVSTAALDDDDIHADDRALYIIDMTDAERSAEKILPPEP